MRAGTLLGVTVVAFAIAAALAYDIFDRVEPFDISDPDSEVVRASRAIEAATGRSVTPEVVLLVSADSKTALRLASSSAARRLRGVPGIASVSADAPALGPPGRRSLVLAYLRPGAGRVDVGEDIDRLFADSTSVLAGGTAVASAQVGEQSESDTRRLELLAAPVLLLLLLVVFRTATSAVLPLTLATLSIVLTFAALRLLTEITTIDLFALQTVTGLGVGLAIDYSLFILTRYREEIAGGRSYEAAQSKTLQTAGRTVAFSSLTVAAALASLLVFPQPFLHSTGIAGALTAIVAGLTALVVLPAVLALLGPAVNRFAIRRDPLRTERVPAAPWRRLAESVCRRPIASIGLGALVMVGLAAQAVGVHVITPDARGLPSEQSARAVADTLVGSPEIPATRLVAVVRDEGGVQASRSSLSNLADVTSVSGAEPLGDGTSSFAITSSVDPLSTAGQDLVSDARDALPRGSLLAGRAAEQADQRSSILDHAPLVVAIVVIANLLLLATMTGSLLLPLIAVTLNLLTVGAAIGTLVIAFTTDLGASLLGTDPQIGIDMSVPVIAFAVGFGLSTDYGIFLFARIGEERLRRGEVGAIVEGVASTGRLISASAVLLAVAVGAFVFSDLVIVKEFAVAIAAAVLLDATIVRILLIPAILRLIGARTWKGPGDARRRQVAGFSPR